MAETQITEGATAQGSEGGRFITATFQSRDGLGTIRAQYLVRPETPSNEPAAGSAPVREAAQEQVPSIPPRPLSPEVLFSKGDESFWRVRLPRTSGE